MTGTAGARARRARPSPRRVPRRTEPRPTRPRDTRPTKSPPFARADARRGSARAARAAACTNVPCNPKAARARRACNRATRSNAPPTCRGPSREILPLGEPRRDHELARLIVGEYLRVVGDLRLGDPDLALADLAQHRVGRLADRYDAVDRHIFGVVATPAILVSKTSGHTLPPIARRLTSSSRPHHGQKSTITLTMRQR